MPTRVLLDTNIVIEMTNDLSWQEWLLRSDPTYIFMISTVTIMEMYALAGQSQLEIDRLDLACDLLESIPVTSAVAKRAALLLRTRTRKNRPDVLIAATALDYYLPLITKNTKDFRGIPGLKVQSTL